MRNIDNPLHPWSQLYVEDIPDLAKGERPSVDSLDKIFRKARLLAYVGGVLILVLFVGVVPGVMLSLHVLSLAEFEIWTHVLQIFCFSMAGIVIVVVPIEEIVQICRQRWRNKQEQRQQEIHKYVYDMSQTSE